MDEPVTADGLRDMLRRGLEAVEDAIKEMADEPRRSDVAEALIFAMFNHCRGLYHSVSHLAHFNQAAAAMVLARPLFEDSVRLGVLAKANENLRLGLILGHRHEAMNQVAQTYEEAQHRGVGDPTILRQHSRHIRQQMREVESIALEHKVRLGKIGSIKPRAIAQGRDWDCYVYNVAHGFVHGGVYATQARLQVDQTAGGIGYGATDNSWVGIGFVAPFAVRSMMYAFEATAEMLGFAVPESLTNVLADANRLMPT